MDLKKGYIILRFESGWRYPVQAYVKKLFHGKVETYHFFAEWRTFDEAKEWLKHGHSQYEIFIDPQTSIGLI